MSTQSYSLCPYSAAFRDIAVVPLEGADKHSRASFHDPITVADVLKSRMIAWPFRILMCCLVTDGGGALILTSADRAKDFPTKPEIGRASCRERVCQYV